MKQRQRKLTEKQRLLLEMQQAGATDAAIAAALGVSVGTVRLKRAALARGLALGAYSNTSAVQMQPDLFTQC